MGSIVAKFWARFPVSEPADFSNVELPQVLRVAARSAAGRSGLLRVAACWEVAEHSGSGWRMDCRASPSRCSTSVRWRRKSKVSWPGQSDGPVTRSHSRSWR